MLDWWGQPRRRIKFPKDVKQLLYEKQKGRCMYYGIKLEIEYFEADQSALRSVGCDFG